MVSRDSLVLTSLRVFDVLDPYLRSSRDTYARSPTTPIYTLYLAYEDSSLSNVFVSTTYSYVYVAFSITTSFSALYPGSCLLRDRWGGIHVTTKRQAECLLRAIDTWGLKLATPLGAIT